MMNWTDVEETITMKFYALLIGSYIIGCLRGLEAFLWLSRLIAPMLSKMERTTIAPPQPDKPKYKVHVW